MNYAHGERDQYDDPLSWFEAVVSLLVNHLKPIKEAVSLDNIFIECQAPGNLSLMNYLLTQIQPVLSDAYIQEKVEDKKITVLISEISAIQIYEKTSSSSSKKHGFSI